MTYVITCPVCNKPVEGMWMRRSIPGLPSTKEKKVREENRVMMFFCRNRIRGRKLCFTDTYRNPYEKSGRIREAIRKARRITAMLQGTMGLEGQGLGRKTLNAMTKLTAKELLEKP